MNSFANSSTSTSTNSINTSIFNSPISGLFLQSLMTSPNNLVRAAALVITSETCHGAGVKQIREYCAAVLTAYPNKAERPALHNLFEVVETVHNHLTKEAQQGQDIGAIDAPQKKFLAPPEVLAACRQSAFEKGQQLAAQFTFGWKGIRIKCLSWSAKKGEMWVDTPIS